jgi:DNA repair exonuclease SbcCD ATPase subunit
LIQAARTPSSAGRTEGKNAVIRGANGTGKTTIEDAFFWLFFNKESEYGKSDFAVVPRGQDNRPLNDIEVSVEASLDIDGTQHTYKRVLKEKLVKKRQQVTGYTSLYWIDEVPRMEKEFKAEIESIMPEQQFRVLTNPMYFNETMTWQERRAILLQLAGDVGCPDGFTALLEELGSRTIREFKKVLSERKKKYNEERENIPPRIDELRKNQPEVAEDTAELDTRREQVKKSQEDIATAFSSLAERETQRTMAVERVNELTAERGKRAAALAADTSAVDGLIQEKQDLRSSLGELEAKVSVAGAKAKNSERDVVREKEDIELLAKRRATIQETLAKAEKQEIADICFNCGQKYPEDKLATAEEDKAKSVAEAQKAGQDVKAKLEAERRKKNWRQPSTPAIRHRARSRPKNTNSTPRSPPARSPSPKRTSSGRNSLPRLSAHRNS